MYDPEPWPYTPAAEQKRPMLYMHRFARLAEKSELAVFMAPSPSLVTVAGADCSRKPGESMIKAFVRCGFPEAAAADSDIVDLQFQVLEGDSEVYSRFVRAAKRQCVRANPKVQVLSQLSTSPGYSATVTTLREAALSVMGSVDGYYLSVAPAATRVGERFVRSLRPVSDAAP
jgi:hypothetical protein